MHNITKELLSEKDENYKKFHTKLVPDTEYEIIGVRVPKVKKIVKTVISFEEIYSFFKEKHHYYEEYLAHGLLIGKIDNTDEIYALLEDFLPLIDNWAICDTTVSALKKLAKNKELLLKNVRKWVKSEKTYTVRFAIVCLLAYFADKEYTKEIIKIVSEINTDEYYINMAIAWLYSVLLIKNYDDAVRLLESKTFPKFIQNKTIDKARDSFRIDKNKKEYLKTLKI